MTALQDIHGCVYNLLRIHARNIDDNGNIIDKELEPISDEVKCAMWDLINIINQESKDG